MGVIPKNREPRAIKWNTFGVNQLPKPTKRINRAALNTQKGSRGKKNAKY